MATATPVWLQKEVTLTQRKRGCHLVTREVVSAVKNELSQIKVGMCHIFIMHTSAVSGRDIIPKQRMCFVCPTAMRKLTKLPEEPYLLVLSYRLKSLTISENADPDVLVDMETHLNRIVPDVGDPGCPTIRHTEEGPDDMASHVKSSLTSTALTIPISNGRLALGVWQGIWLLEHRFYGGPRRLTITLNGSPA